MGQKILVATPQDLLRKGLRTIFLADQRVSEVYEARSSEELSRQLVSRDDLDFLIVNQTLISDLTILPQHRFAILTAKPDLTVMRIAYERGARGYFSTGVPADMLRSLLNPTPGVFFIDPLLSAWIIEGMIDTPHI